MQTLVTRRTIVTTGDDPQRRNLHLSDRDRDLNDDARQGYVLVSSVVVPLADTDAVLILDTLGRDLDE
jgi:hypothetical protein